MINLKQHSPEGARTALDAASTAGRIALLALLCLTNAAGFLWTPPAVGFRNPELARIVVFHVPCSITAYTATGVATWYAIRYLMKRDLLDDMKSRTSFGLALVFWTLTTVTGAVFAKAEWGQAWNWDIKQWSILMLLLIYTAYFALRSSIEDTRKRATVAAVYALFGLLAAPYLTLILPNSTPDTLHPKGTLAGGLSVRYSITLWLQAVGVILVYVWAFRLSVAVDVLEERLRRFSLRPARTAVLTRAVRKES